MSTVRLFDENSYTFEFSATVIACRPRGDGFAVVLDRTAFCPEGGGQKGDSGTLGTATVIHTVEEAEILHLTDRPLRVGDRCRGVLIVSAVGIGCSTIRVNTCCPVLSARNTGCTTSGFTWETSW